MVNIYLDGTVLVTHGGTEMGQGLHTKIIQIASKELQVPVGQVTITETATDKVPNSSPTAASAGSDLYGMAVLHACEQLSERLKPYRDSGRFKSFAEIVRAAYFDRVNLSAQGFYEMPVSGFDYEMKTKIIGSRVSHLHTLRLAQRVLRSKLMFLQAISEFFGRISSWILGIV